MTQKPLTIIGLDGACWDLLRPWIDEGRLPNLASVFKSGINSNLVSTIPPITGAALPSFFTGMNPGNTGIFGFFNPDGSLASYRSLKHPAIWDYLGNAGIKSCIVGLRLTYPPKKINGIMLSGGLLRTENDDFIQPAKLISIARDYHPRKDNLPFLYNALKSGKVKPAERFTEELIELTRLQFSTFLKLKNSDHFPFSLLWIENTDVLQHFCWSRKDLILKLYEEIDARLGDFLPKNGDSNLLIMSDHGFEKGPSYDFNINSWLSSNQFLKQDRNIFRQMRKRTRLFISQRLLKPYTKRKIRFFLEKLRVKQKKKRPPQAVNPDIIINLAAKKLGFDPLKTKAFAKDGFGIHINKKAIGDYEAFRSDLISRLAELTDATGHKVIKSVWRKEDVFKGIYLNQIPDIIFLTHGDFKVYNHFSSEWITLPNHKRDTTGSHNSSLYGIFMAVGNDISRAEMQDIKIIDILPTVLRYFRIEVPDYIDGDQKLEIFKDYIGKQKPLKTSAGLKDTEDDDRSSFTEEEEEELKKQLKTLGYIE